MNNLSEKVNDFTPFVSIVVPVFNDEKYLPSCLDSIFNQTVASWEAILVDDCSTDKSAEIAEKYCAADPRFHLIRNSRNSSAWTCRAKGILAAEGKYIMFVDADDSMMLEAVECVSKILYADPSDVLHFGTNVVNRYGLKVHQMYEYSDYLSPVIGILRGREVFDSFVERKFEGHLWNKAFSAALLKKIISDLGEELYLPKAQDKVLYWAVCLSKKDLTYRGVKNKLYNYNYGLGVENSQKFWRTEDCIPFLSQAWSEDKISEITELYSGEKFSEYLPVLEHSRYSLIRHSMSKIFELPGDMLSDVLLLALDYWKQPMDIAMLICALAEFSWDCMPETARKLISLKCFPHISNNTPRVIGTYYECMNNGGIQRVISGLAEIWHDLGYEVVLFTDEAPSPDDYPLPDYVKRKVIARRHDCCDALCYRERGMSFARLIAENKIDYMVYHSYFSPVLLYDELICKLMGIPFVLYQHNSFSRYLLESDVRFSSISYCSSIADHVVCLSDTDRGWWNCLNSRTSVVLNPLTFDLNSVQAADRKGHDILYVGRLCEESKHPLHSIEIAAKVMEKYPDTKLRIVGSTDDQLYLNTLRKRIKELGAEKNILLCGFQKDVSVLYANSSVFLSCSTYEGFMLTLYEAMSYSIPIVMYDLPYLTAVQNNHGIISVPQGDIEAAAEAICRLFSDEEQLQAVGGMGRKCLERIYKTDIGTQWAQILDPCDNKKPAVETDSFSMAIKLADDHLSAMRAAQSTEPSLIVKAIRFFKRYGIVLTIRRIIEKTNQKRGRKWREQMNRQR